MNVLFTDYKPHDFLRNIAPYILAHNTPSIRGKIKIVFL